MNEPIETRLETIVIIRLIFKAHCIRGHNDLARLIAEYTYGFDASAWIHTLKRVPREAPDEIWNYISVRDVWHVMTHYTHVSPIRRSWMPECKDDIHVLAFYSSPTGFRAVIDYMANTIGFDEEDDTRDETRIRTLIARQQIWSSPLVYRNAVEEAVKEGKCLTKEEQETYRRSIQEAINRQRQD
jgi:hypothetical protein